MPKVVILETPRSSYHAMFSKAGWQVKDNWGLEDADLVCFTGGTDVNPALYNQGLHPRTQFPDISRDSLEQKIFRKCVRDGIPMVGICRGAQFLCVENKGKLVQHVTNHAIGGKHEIITTHGDFQATSSHHQMMDPTGTEHLLIGYAKGLSSTYEGATETDIAFRIKTDNLPKHADGEIIEPEVVFFPKTQAMCHQPHPEWQVGSAYEKFFFDTIEQYLGVKA